MAGGEGKRWSVKGRKASVFFLQAEDGIRDAQESRGLGDVYKRQLLPCKTSYCLKITR